MRPLSIAMQNFNVFRLCLNVKFQRGIFYHIFAANAIYFLTLRRISCIIIQDIIIKAAVPQGIAMTDKQRSFIELALLAKDRGTIKKIIFSRPEDSEIKKVSARLCDHKGRRMLALEYSLPGDTVSQKNIYGTDNMRAELSELIEKYRQANLITALGDAEWKMAKDGGDVLLGGDKLERRLADANATFDFKMPTLEREKSYVLSGKEEFLFRLGIASADGRIHDKKQGKFRQINRFLEHIEDVYKYLPSNGELTVYDLCCGKSYLSFAVYYYLTAVKGRAVNMLGIDLKRDVISWCDGLARELGFAGMSFIATDITKAELREEPDLVMSLHACDIATDVVVNTAIRLRARVLLSTPCCHRYLNDKIKAEALAFVTDHPHLRNKLCEAVTDALRAARLDAAGYAVSVVELTDPDDTPKNTLIRAIRKKRSENECEIKREKYEKMLSFILGDGKEEYLKGL